MERPEWCKVGAIFEWQAPHITGADVAIERIIGYTDDGFLHTAAYCPIYETKFDCINSGIVIRK